MAVQGHPSCSATLRPIHQRVPQMTSLFYTGKLKHVSHKKERKKKKHTEKTSKVVRVTSKVKKREREKKKHNEAEAKTLKARHREKEDSQTEKCWCSLKKKAPRRVESKLGICGKNLRRCVEAVSKRLICFSLRALHLPICLCSVIILLLRLFLFQCPTAGL